MEATHFRIIIWLRLKYHISLCFFSDRYSERLWIFPYCIWEWVHLTLNHMVMSVAQVLRKEITIQELQNYGYCLFKALAYLHKQVRLAPLTSLPIWHSKLFWSRSCEILQGIVHRDVKPGNFLFSRTRGTGYLVDFNLALVRWSFYFPESDNILYWSITSLT